MSIAAEIEKLEQLRSDGVMTNEEFDVAKGLLLGNGNNISAPDDEMRVRTWAMCLHLSALAGFVTGIGYFAPVIVWMIKKDEMPAIDAHGKEAINWMISGLIYGAVSCLLCFFLVGIPLLFAVMIMWLVFPIIAGMKANQGVLWKYPLTIRFLS